MPHPIYGPPEHALEVVHARLEVPTRRNGRRASLRVNGTSSTKRGDLWSYAESWDPLEHSQLLQPTDTLQWVILAAVQDRPASQAMLEVSLRPGGYEDTPLPF